ncbi:MAG: hypothetical protein RLZZ152_500, partial [Pseudomonadota bacterium]
FRAALLDKHPRHKGVLELAAAKADWGKPLKPGKPGEKRGRGVAVHESFNTFVAQVAEVTVDKDEGPRADTSLEGLAKLRAVFAAKGSVTAGNSSQTSDGAGALILVSEKILKQFNLTPLARFASFAVRGVPPEIMDKLASAVDAAMKNPAITDRLKIMGIEPMGGTRASFNEFVNAERAKLGNIIRATGMKED